MQKLFALSYALTCVCTEYVGCWKDGAALREKKMKSDSQSNANCIQQCLVSSQNCPPPFSLSLSLSHTHTHTHTTHARMHTERERERENTFLQIFLGIHYVKDVRCEMVNMAYFQMSKITQLCQSCCFYDK